jgi:protein-S-isoprenylcysteine O-methyltransferase Ste14
MSVTEPRSRRADTARVAAPPPILLLGAWAAARLLHLMVPAGIPGARPEARRVLGWSSILIGLGLSAAVVLKFRAAATAVSPLHATTALVQDGPYHVTRNPDYIGQLLVYAGSAVASNTLWPIVVLPLVLFAVDRGVVRREERYLAAKFGAEYDAYAARVPRWLWRNCHRAASDGGHRQRGPAGGRW